MASQRAQLQKAHDQQAAAKAAADAEVARQRHLVAAVQAKRAEYEARRAIVCERLRAMPGLRLNVPDGAFYAFFDVSSYFGRTLGGRPIKDSVGFCQAALEVGHVVPGHHQSVGAGLHRRVDRPAAGRTGHALLWGDGRDHAALAGPPGANRDRTAVPRGSACG